MIGILAAHLRHAQLDICTISGCQMAQGFLMACPGTAESIEHILDSERLSHTIRTAANDPFATALKAKPASDGARLGGLIREYIRAT